MSNPTPPVILNFIPLFLIFIIFYFLIIRPQKTKQMEHKKMIDGLSKNDEVVMAGGIHGTVINVKEKTLIIRVDENTKIEVDKDAVSYLKKGNA